MHSHSPMCSGYSHHNGRTEWEEVQTVCIFYFRKKEVWQASAKKRFFFSEVLTAKAPESAQFVKEAERTEKEDKESVKRPLHF
ncbi:hypothetical protein XELAEV_18021298mg [Xenopus laevis]|uniref:Uncharacterized protein n=1 Tax=Xenopus laevis TaxID=8355 RepID=A0A974HRV0_XENLA|nr:hypothetical protein XELAEV_18021298mg [Xenopus laevis]